MKEQIFEPELKLIKNDRLREAAIYFINQLPDYFFEIAASSTGKYHPEFAASEGGLVKHTKVAVRIADTIIQTVTIGGNFTSDEKDLILISLILHDGLKEGMIKEKYTRFDHPILMAKLIQEKYKETTLEELEAKIIASNIASHMGEWNTTNYSNVVLPTPKNKFQKMVHMCDLLASRKFINVEFDGLNIKY